MHFDISDYKKRIRCEVQKIDIYLYILFQGGWGEGQEFPLKDCEVVLAYGNFKLFLANFR